MYKKFKDYDFREIVGHFVLMRNTTIINDPDNSYIDERIEEAKKHIVEDTKNYYKDVYGYDESFDYENTFSIDALNEEMTTRKITDLYEPMYGYVCIEKNRGFILYILGNDEDKMKYIYAPTYWSCEKHNVDNFEMKILDDDEFEHSKIFKEHIEFDEEQDEDVIKTRELTNLDMFRLKFSPDFVTCIVSYKNTNYTAKVKLSRYENNTIYAKYHEQEGIISLVKQNNATFLFFKPIHIINEKEALNKYILNIMDGLEKDFDIERENCLKIIKDFQFIIEKGYINGDLSFETVLKIIDVIDEEINNIEETEL